MSIGAKKMVGFTATGVILLMIASLSLLAQETRGPSGAGAESTTAVLYLFTGAVDRGDSGMATTVHCTNLGATIATVTIEISSGDGMQVTAGNFALAANETKTASTRNTSAYAEDVVLAPAVVIDQGFGRILVDTSGSTKVICTAQALDPNSGTPTFNTNLTLIRQ